VTFVPCFLFIFVGASHVECLRGNRVVSGALGGITAAVVGVIANLAVYFAVHTLFAATRTVSLGPFHLVVADPGTLRPVAAAIAVAAAVMGFRLRWSVLRTLGACALLGLLTGLAGLPVA
jgi:chromate transporter